MRILFLSGAQGPDYQCDSLMHGFRSLLGEDVVDIKPMWHMYASSFKEGKNELQSLYGKGFTLYGLLPNGSIDRGDLESKLRTRFYDFVVFGSIIREFSMLGPVREFYSGKRIILIDGEDTPNYPIDFTTLGHYFKRELHNVQPHTYPIEFAIPKEKIAGCGIKSHFWAPCDPADTRTYVYKTEAAYYQQYRAAMFAKTMKKAGWCALRHYEIMACNCIPYFRNLEDLPPGVMINLPRKELMYVKHLIDYDGGKIFNSVSGQDLWSDIMAKLEANMLLHHTTEALAKYVLDTVQRSN